MNRLSKIATAVAFSLGLAGAAYAQSDQAGGGMGHGAHQGGQHQGMQGGQGHGRHADKGPGTQAGKEGCGMQRGAKGGRHGAQRQGGERQAAQQLMTPEERTAIREKMRNAATPEERQQIALATRAEMQKRATEKGITLPEHRGPRGRGPGPAAAPTAPATTEHAH